MGCRREITIPGLCKQPNASASKPAPWHNSGASTINECHPRHEPWLGLRHKKTERIAVWEASCAILEQRWVETTPRAPSSPQHNGNHERVLSNHYQPEPHENTTTVDEELQSTETIHDASRLLVQPKGNERPSPHPDEESHAAESTSQQRHRRRSRRASRSRVYTRIASPSTPAQASSATTTVQPALGRCRGSRPRSKSSAKDLQACRPARRTHPEAHVLHRSIGSLAASPPLCFAGEALALPWMLDSAIPHLQYGLWKCICTWGASCWWPEITAMCTRWENFPH